MKLINTCTSSHIEMKDRWFLPSIKDKFEISFHQADIKGPGNYMESDWTQAVLFKGRTVVQAIRENIGEVLIFSDVDIQFFAPVREKIIQALKNKDIVCQLDNPYGELCTGFFALRANRLTLSLWEQVVKAAEAENREQPAFNRILRSMNHIRFGYLPVEFFGAGTFRPMLWNRGDRIYIPPSPVMFHANWTVGVENKIFLLQQVRNTVRWGKAAIMLSNMIYSYKNKKKEDTKHFDPLVAENQNKKSFLKISEYRPRAVCLEASTVCQLRCRTCPTSHGIIGKNIGSGFLSPDNFRKFIDEHPWITDIELSNWGEVFLNPGLKEIFEYAQAKQVMLHIDNGANLNDLKDEVAEALVKNKVRSMTVSIDGVSQETYSSYRIRGNYDQVIKNIEKINEFKNRYNSRVPYLVWQFVAFGHNEHEIKDAKRLAGELGMKFKLKLSWDDLYFETFSPVKDKQLIRSESETGVADRQEYEEKYGRNYIDRCCLDFWLNPRINFDGKLLVCCINYWEDFGNVFENGLEDCLRGEKMKYAREMLMGLKPGKEGIPCTICKVYKNRKKLNNFVRMADLDDYYP